MQNQSSTYSMFTIGSISQRSNKRKKIDVGFPLREVDGLKQGRKETFSHYPYSKSFRSRLIEAGFFGCNNDDRVICLYCNLICHRWEVEIDDPCVVHKTFSPGCPYVTSMSCCHSSQYNKIVSKAPGYIDYVDPQKRLATFSTWSTHGFPSIDKFVGAGFFYDGSKITCFYCNGSFERWESKNHPLAEHVRYFPQCNYARQLCGEELYYKIQRAIKYPPRNVGIGELQNDNQGPNVFDDDTLSKLADDRLDLPFAIYLLDEQKFERSIIKRCWMDQFRLKHDDFKVDCDFHIACEVLQRQTELIEEKNENIIIPSISLMNMYKKKQIPSGNNSNQSYSDILESFEKDLETYKNARQTLGAQFTEHKTITIEREQSLDKCPYNKPSRPAFTKGGWILSDAENHVSKCPHCHMQYSYWKSDDDPLLIHKYLSPLCLFVLSLNPLNTSSIPIRKVNEQYTDEDIRNAQSRPYTGLIQTRHDSMCSVGDRRTSFNRFLHDCRVNSDELAAYGFCYTSRDRSMMCFYCKCKMPLWNRSARSNQYFTQLHRFSQCRYIQQLNDHDPQLSIQQVSNKCTWCMTEEKRLVALPCRHFCLCQSCGEIKRLCPICKDDVTAYIVVYPS